MQEAAGVPLSKIRAIPDRKNRESRHTDTLHPRTEKKMDLSIIIIVLLLSKYYSVFYVTYYTKLLASGLYT